MPFCFHKCHYCDFYSIVDSQDRQADFTARLIDEIHTGSTILPDRPRPETIFVGGGTPTLLRIPLWNKLLQAVGERLLAPGAEFTVEANPETVTPELAQLLASGGVNRVSIGAQSFNPAHLKTLERWHDPRNVRIAVERFRAAGIGSINLDLIFGVPGQTLDDWLADLSEALALRPNHLSCYGLMYEPNTALTARLRAGRITRIDEDLEAAMYEATIDTLGEAGFEQYEISAWAAPGSSRSSRPGAEVRNDHRCRHNLLYWTNANWWPLGPSASGHWNGVRWKNVARLGEYLASRGWPPITDVERVDDETRIGEELMLGLRLIAGISSSRLTSILAGTARGEERAAAIRHAIARGLLERRDGRVRLTRRGLLLADAVLAELI